MSYKVRVTSIKPQNVAWFTEVSQEAKDTIARYSAAVRGAAGALSFKKTNPDANTVVREYEFDTKENYDAFIALSMANPDGAARRNYNNQNGIITTFDVL